jgi:hypothetical protein
MKTWMKLVPLMVGVLLIAVAANPIPLQAGDNPNPPDEIVKLIFIHHSTGENWLTDGYGNLGRTLDQNTILSAIPTMGGADAIGDRTDIPNWTEWFAGSENTPTYMKALFHENASILPTRTLSDRAGNEIVIFKSCFPNSALEESRRSTDPEGGCRLGHEVSITKSCHICHAPDKLFIVVTARRCLIQPMPRMHAFNQWLLTIGCARTTIVSTMFLFLISITC